MIQTPHLAQNGQGRPADKNADLVKGAGDVPAPLVISHVPIGGSQLLIEKQGDQTRITATSVPPDVWRLAHGAERSAFGLMGLFAAIIILGPFARMIARRMERREEGAPSPDVLGLRQQIEFLQTSIDTMSVEMERISESQRFQSRLLFEGKSGDAAQAQNAAPAG